MSLLTPVKVPVKVYRWDDAGAPALDKTPNCMMTIFKACLVTGYGTKEGAGWTMPFEDPVAKVKVFRPPVTADTDYYLRCSADNGKQMTTQVYQNMTAQNKGALRLQCATPFKYAAATNVSGKWLLIASTRGFWFFNEQDYPGDNPAKTGAYFYCGDSTASSAGDRQIYLQHTGGTYTDGDFDNIMGWRAGSEQGAAVSFVFAKVLSVSNTVSTTRLQCLASGMTALSTDDVVTPPVFFAKNKIYMLPGVYIPFNGAVYNNFDAVTINKPSGTINCINFGTAGQGASNLYIATDEWVF